MHLNCFRSFSCPLSEPNQSFHHTICVINYAIKKVLQTYTANGDFIRHMHILKTVPLNNPACCLLLNSKNVFAPNEFVGVPLLTTGNAMLNSKKLQICKEFDEIKVHNQEQRMKSTENRHRKTYLLFIPHRNPNFKPEFSLNCVEKKIYWLHILEKRTGLGYSDVGCVNKHVI